MNKQEYAEYEKSVADGLDGLTGVSTGCCPGCIECKEAGCPEHDDCSDPCEPWFSWRSCDVCDSPLGGDREHAHGVDKNNDILHIHGVCTDCVYYIAYGHLDDQSMLDIEASA